MGIVWLKIVINFPVLFIFYVQKKEAVVKKGILTFTIRNDKMKKKKNRNEEIKKD